MKIRVEREVYTDISTIGKLYIDDKFYCYTLEDKVRKNTDKKIYGETAIPSGEYEIVFRKEGTTYTEYKDKFKDIRNDRGTLHIINIPEYKYVLIHIGNYPKDTLGCILVGLAFTTNQLIKSTDAYKIIYPIIANALESGEKVFIEVKNTKEI